MVCERKRAEEALFLQREPPPCRVWKRAEQLDLTSIWGGRMSGHEHPLPLPPRLPTQIKRGGAEVGVEVWCEAAAPLSPPTTSAEAVTRHQPPPPPRACEAAVVPCLGPSKPATPRVTEIQAQCHCLHSLPALRKSSVARGATIAYLDSDNDLEIFFEIPSDWEHDTDCARHEGWFL